MKRLYVGNLEWSVTNEELRSVFEEIGKVEEVKIIMFSDTKRSKGFGFVEMTTEEDAKRAIDRLTGFEILGRKIIVREANVDPKKKDRYTSLRKIQDFIENGQINKRFDFKAGVKNFVIVRNEDDYIDKEIFDFNEPKFSVEYR